MTAERLFFRRSFSFVFSFAYDRIFVSWKAMRSIVMKLQRAEEKTLGVSIHIILVCFILLISALFCCFCRRGGGIRRSRDILKSGEIRGDPSMRHRQCDC